MMTKKMSGNISGKLFNFSNYVIMILIMLFCVYPFYYVLIYSISDAEKASRGVYFLPAGIDFTTYIKVLEKGDIGNAFFISITKTVLFTVLCVIVTAMFAYLVTQRDMLFRKFVYRFTVITLYMNAGLIPYYITMKAYGLKDNYLLYIIPGCLNIFYMILIKTFIEQLPSSLEEAASIDGAGFFTKFFRIIFPLCKPIIATVAVYASVGAWNSWMDNYLLIRNPKLQTLQLILYNYLNEAERVANSMMHQPTSGTITQPTITPNSVRMAITVITVTPIMMVYPFLQKYFVKGIMMGAIKG